MEQTQPALFETPETAQPTKARVNKVTKTETEIEIPAGEIAKAVNSFLLENGIKLQVDSKLKEVEETFLKETMTVKNQLAVSILEEVSRQVQKLRPVIIKVPNQPAITLEGRAHKDLKECLSLTSVHRQTFLSGPAGTGKTTLAEQVSKAMGLNFGFISCTLGMSETHILGRETIHGDYINSSFIDIFENGGIFLFDEIDAADPNTCIVLNAALANGIVSIPKRKEKPYAKRHENCFIIAAANTWGYGSSQYVGRNMLDEATLNRFCGSFMYIDYDTELERDIAGEYSQQLCPVIWKIRENVMNQKMKRVISTRAIVEGTKALITGKTVKQFIERLLTPFTPEEKSKALKDLSL